MTLRVLTAGGLALEERATSIVAPGEMGYLGVLRNHAPLVTTIKAGRLRWRNEDGTSRELSIGEGLFEISHNTCTLLTTHVQEPAA